MLIYDLNNKEANCFCKFCNFIPQSVHKQVSLVMDFKTVKEEQYFTKQVKCPVCLFFYICDGDIMQANWQSLLTYLFCTSCAKNLAVLKSWKNYCHICKFIFRVEIENKNMAFSENCDYWNNFYVISFYQKQEYVTFVFTNILFNILYSVGVWYTLALLRSCLIIYFELS